MKKLFALVAVFGMLYTGTSSIAVAQDPSTQSASQVDSTAAAQPDQTVGITDETLPEEATPQSSLHKRVKQIFIEGGALFMSFILLTFIFGLAIAIERIIYLNLSTTNTEKLLQKI